MTRTSFQRLVLFGVPAAYIPLGILHPLENPEVGDATSVFLALHVVQLVLVTGLGYVIWLSVAGIRSRGAQVARALILPFVVAYTALDTLLGLAWGYLAQQATDLPTAEHAAAQHLVEAVLKPSGPGVVLYFGAGLLWVAAVMAIVTAHFGRAPTPALMAMGSGAIVFAAGHAAPTGPLGMALFLIGILIVERAPRARERDQTASISGVGSTPIWLSSL